MCVCVYIYIIKLYISATCNIFSLAWCIQYDNRGFLSSFLVVSMNDQNHSLLILFSVMYLLDEILCCAFKLWNLQ